MSPRPAVYRRHLPGSPFNTPDERPPVEHFEVNDRVAHDKYGLGTVVSVDDDVAILVDFGAGQARIASPFSKVTKL